MDKMKIAGGVELDPICLWSCPLLPSEANCLPVSSARLVSRVAAFFATARDVAAIEFGDRVDCVASVEYSTMFWA